MTSWTGPGGFAARAADAWWGVPTRKVNLPQASPYTPQHEGACVHGVSTHLPAAGGVPTPRARGGRRTWRPVRSCPRACVGREERRGLACALGLTVGAEREHALVERVGDVVYLRLRTELRTLQSLVAFRSSVPDEVAEAFVSAGDVEKAEQDPGAGRTSGLVAQPHPAGGLARPPALVRAVRGRRAAGRGAGVGPGGPAHLPYDHGQGAQPRLPGRLHPPGADGRRRDGRGRRGAAGVAPQLRPRQPGPARLRRTNQSNPVRGPGGRSLGRRVWRRSVPWRPGIWTVPASCTAR